jgi:hypothetical protein
MLKNNLILIDLIIYINLIKNNSKLNKYSFIFLLEFSKKKNKKKIKILFRKIREKIKKN